MLTGQLLQKDLKEPVDELSQYLLSHFTRRANISCAALLLCASSGHNVLSKEGLLFNRIRLFSEFLRLNALRHSIPSSSSPPPFSPAPPHVLALSPGKTLDGRRPKGSKGPTAKIPPWKKPWISFNSYLEER